MNDHTDKAILQEVWSIDIEMNDWYGVIVCLVITQGLGFCDMHHVCGLCVNKIPIIQTAADITSLILNHHNK